MSVRFTNAEVALSLGQDSEHPKLLPLPSHVTLKTDLYIDVQRVADAVLQSAGDLMVFVSEDPPCSPHEVWAFAHRVAFRVKLSRTTKYPVVEIYNAVRDIHGIRVVQTEGPNEEESKRTVTATVRLDAGAGDNEIELKATGKNCKLLYDVLPYLCGLEPAPNAPEANAGRDRKLTSGAQTP